jgi:hypothetical protein
MSAEVMRQRTYMREYQMDYYKKNTEEIRRRRLRKKLMSPDPDVRDGVRAATIHKYGLVEFAKEQGRDVSDEIRNNRIDSQVTEGINREVVQKVEDRLDKFDEAIRDLIKEKEQQKKNFEQSRPLKSGTLTLKDVIERLGFVDFENTTLQGRRSLLANLFKYHLKDPGDNVAGTFNDYKTVIKKIRNARQFKPGPNQGKPYADLTSFYNIPISLYKNVAEFRAEITPEAFQAYKLEFDKENNASFIRTTTEKKKMKYHDLNELHLVRKFYGYDAPGSIWHLISALYTLQYGVRNDYGCVRLITRENGVTDDGTHNFLDVETGRMTLNRYKTGKKKGTLKLDFSDTLMDIIRLWLRRSGNQKFLIATRNYQASQRNSPDEELHVSCEKEGHNSSMGNLVAQTFNFYLRRQKSDMSVGITAIRHIWSNWIANNVPDIKERTEIAMKMGHSLQMQQMTYVRDTYGVNSETLKMLEDYKDYGEPGFPLSDAKIMKGIDILERNHPENWTAIEKKLRAEARAAKKGAGKEDAGTSTTQGKKKGGKKKK